MYSLMQVVLLPLPLKLLVATMHLQIFLLVSLVVLLAFTGAGVSETASDVCCAGCSAGASEVAGAPEDASDVAAGCSAAGLLLLLQAVLVFQQLGVLVCFC